MGRPRKNATRPERGLQADALKALWKRIDVDTWHRIISKADPKGNWEVHGKHSIKGRCPYHDESTGSFSLNFNMCLGKCFGACGKVVTDLVGFYAKLARKSYSAALLELSGELDIAGIIGQATNELPAFHNHQEMKKWAAIAMRMVITEYAREKPKHLEYIKPAFVYLTKGRNLPIEALSHLPVGVFAKPEHLKKHIPEEFHRDLEKYFSKVDGKTWWGSICFHYNDQPGSISRFKLRKLVNDAAGICRDDAITHEAARALAEKNFFVVEDEYISEMGVFGLHHYSHHLGDKETNAYATEGEFDALSVIASQIVLGRPDFMIFAVGGNGNAGISFLREFGIRTIWMVQDSPAKNGDGVVRQLFLNNNNFIEDTDNPALQFKVFQWPKSMRGGDLDEAVNLMGYEEVARHLVFEKSSFFLNSYSWVLEKCENEVAEIAANLKKDLNALPQNQENRVQRDNLSMAARENTVAVVRNWFRCLHDENHKLSFVQHYAQSQQIDLSRISEINSAIYELDSLQGAAKRIADALSEFIDIAYYEVTTAGSQFTIFNKRTSVMHILPINEEGRESVLTQCIGRNVVDWVCEVLKGSKIFGKPTGDPFIDAINVKKRVLRILKEAFLLIYPSVAVAGSMIKIGQGIHHQGIRKQNQNGDVIYMVNGDKVFKGVYSDTSANPCEWKRLSSCVDEKFFFMLNVQKTWSAVEDESDLYSSAQIDLRRLYDDIRVILDGWKFAEHELMRDYLAAWIMSLPVQKAMGYVNMTFVTGQTTSGKTSFVRGLLGGTLTDSAFEVPTIIEGAWFSSDATAAGIYQEMDKSSLTLCLDEAEARQDDAHSARVASFQSMAFSIPFGGSSVMRGGASPNARNNYSMQMPVVMAAINMASEPTFLNRVVPVYTEKDMSRKNIGTYIHEHFTDEQIAKLRKDITVCMLSHLPALVERLPKLRQELAQVEVPVKINDRYITIFLPALVIYEYLGFDARTMFQRLIEKNKDLIENFNSADSYSDLVTTCLYTGYYRATIDSGNVANLISAADLILSGEIALLNSSTIGVYLLPERHWLVFIWRTIKTGVLRNTKYANYDEAALRETISKNSYVIHNISREDHDYIVRSLGRSDIKSPVHYSVISSEYLLDVTVPQKGRETRNTDTPVCDLPEIPVSAYEEELSRVEDNSEYTL